MNRKSPFLKALLAGFFLLAAAFSLYARPAADEKPADKPSKLRTGLEIGFSGGVGAYDLNDMSQMSRGWSTPGYSTIGELGSISLEQKAQPAVAFSLTGFFAPSWGIRLEADALVKRTFTQGASSAYTATWEYNFFPAPRGNSASAFWPLNGGFQTTVVSLDLVYRFSIGPAFEAYFMAGPANFRGQFHARTTTGYFYVWQDGIVGGGDWFPVSLSLSQNISGLGLNAGGGFDLRLWQGLKFGIEIAYFMGPKATADWTLLPGSYPEAYQPGTYVLSLTQAMVEAINFPSRMSGVNLSLSFVRLSAGFKIGL
jgi:hypothetical protein